MAGRGRGRGRGAAGGLKGVTWDYDPTLKLDAKPTDLYPTHPNIRRPAPQTIIEGLQVKHFKRLQEQIHRGPLYTQSSKLDLIVPLRKFGEEQVNRQSNKSRKAHVDPFLGVETYCMRYAPKKNELPKLSQRPFNKELFPKELWPTLEGLDSTDSRRNLNGSLEKKKLIIDGMEPIQSDRAKIVLEKIHSLDVEGEEEEDEENDEQAEVDDEFDDDELGGDYDAEQYFDGGEGDSDIDGGGGGDDDY